MDCARWTEIGKQSFHQPSAWVDASIHPAVRAYRPLLDPFIGIGQGELWDTHHETYKGDLDLSSDQELASCAAFAWTPVGSIAPNTYFLAVSGKAAFNSVAMLEQLTHSSPAHQYFDLIPTPTVLMVSAGEYDSSWWDGVESG